MMYSAVRGRSKVLLYFPALSPAAPRGNGPIAEPLPLLALAPHLEAAGFEVLIHDARLPGDVSALLTQHRDSLLCVGVSVMGGYQVVDGHAFSRRVKASCPELPIIWGGWFPTTVPEQCVDSGNVDLALRGQGEERFSELARRLARGAACDDIPGLSYKRDGRIVHHPAPPLVDPNSFLPKDYGRLDPRQYSHGNGLLHYATSVGCPFQCSFCGPAPYFNRTWYGLNPARVVSEIKAITREHQVRQVAFWDFDFFIDLSRVKAILRGFLAENFTFSWFALCNISRALEFDEELFELLRATRCLSIGVGVESGSQRIRDLYDKGFSGAQFDLLLERFAPSGIAVRTNFMIGPPTETREEFMESLRAMCAVRRAHPRNVVSLLQFTPVPWTRLYRHVEHERKERLPNSLAEWEEFYRGYLEVHEVPWLAPKDAFGRQPALFYFKLAFMNPKGRGRLLRIPLSVIKMIAALRVRHEVFALPLLWYLAMRLRSVLVRRFLKVL